MPNLPFLDQDVCLTLAVVVAVVAVVAVAVVVEVVVAVVSLIHQDCRRRQHWQHDHEWNPQ
jgi:hypothetical protein